MVVVAIAGGLGDLGRIIVSSIQALPRHNVYVLTRKAVLNPDIGNATVLDVDYTSITALTETIDKYKIHTIISALNMDWKSVETAQLNLIHAAGQSKTVKRFAPSEFNIDYSFKDEILPYPQKNFHLSARALLATYPALETTLFYNGFFMDYFALPYAPTNLRPLYTIVDIPNASAAIPGDGNARMAVTYTLDVGRYVAASLDLQTWPKVSVIKGDIVTCNELVKLVEKIGGEPFKISHDSVEEMEAGKVTELVSNREAYPHFPEGKKEVDGLSINLGIGIANGCYDVKGMDLVELLPDVEKPVKLEAFLRSCLEGRAKL